MVWVCICCIKCTNVCFCSQRASWALILFVLQRLPYCHMTHRITVESHLTLFKMNSDASQRSREKTPKNQKPFYINLSFWKQHFLYIVYISTFIYIDILINFFFQFQCLVLIGEGKKTQKKAGAAVKSHTAEQEFFPFFFLSFFFLNRNQNRQRKRDKDLKKEKEESFLHIQPHICTEDYSGSQTSQYS